ncbi:DsbA family protein [Streptomyces sp. CBMA29]|uniref:DsbA family oxidoreductase n=1 Tax=Streptomyces sp. CBMA29 TaxID=1896314 RepID=UPI001661E405|nr:DsbA family protein [Streptomyces sp. CBMA29]MBD0736864.1 hypothetical protein [Streptomyces sp. CBMA29]
MTGPPPPGGTDHLHVTEYTDPLCPWAWGSEPVFRALRAALGEQASWRRVFGILFDTDDDPAPDPAAETRWYEGFVREISGHTGAPHAARLSRVAATSWPASLVAKAAEAQGGQVADWVLRRLRETMFVTGEPADTLDLALAAADGVPGLDPVRLAADAASPQVLAAVTADRRETRAPLTDALTAALADALTVTAAGPHPGAAKETPSGELRYALPTVVLTGPLGRRVVPGRRPTASYLEAALAVAPGVSVSVERPSAEALLAYHRSLTRPEWELLAPGVTPPASAVLVATGNGPLWLHPAEAAAYPAPVSAPPSPR